MSGHMWWSHIFGRGITQRWDGIFLGPAFGLGGRNCASTLHHLKGKNKSIQNIIFFKAERGGGEKVAQI